MRSLGIDPGTHRIGWGVVEGDPSEQKTVAYGCIELNPHTKSAEYLMTLRNELEELIDEHSPDFASVEKIFFQKNKKTAIQVAQARGVILLTLAEKGLPYHELAPNTIKSAVAGNGRASKKQVASMVEMLLDLDKKPELDDISDALATAIASICIGTLSL